MGSASKQALARVKGTIDRTHGASLASGTALFDAANAIGRSAQLRAALSDAGASAEAKRALVRRLFGGRLDGSAAAVLDEAVGQRWSDEREFALGLQELAIRAVAQFTGRHEQIARELRSFLDVVAGSSELELTLGAKLGEPQAKAALVDRLFGGRLDEATLEILRRLVVAPHGRRLRRVVAQAVETVADQASRQLAVVTVARPLAESQLTRLQLLLARRFGRPVAVSQLVDPAVLGGLRVQLGDEVIDDTVAGRLGDLRRQFA